MSWMKVKASMRGGWGLMMFNSGDIRLMLWSLMSEHVSEGCGRHTLWIVLEGGSNGTAKDLGSLSIVKSVSSELTLVKVVAGIAGNLDSSSSRQ